MCHSFPYWLIYRHLALDREHLERSEAKLKGEVESRAAQPIAAKMELEDKLSQVEVSCESMFVHLHSSLRVLTFIE